ncbi:endonuclease/exonuclease/phosphatase family protein [Bifidobacteriaceae bacterium NR002]|nr:endonuclease/exonuclease/phosphatase family protein [Bifidobacteriaceae bacterium NR002]MDZ7549956.1 endonuclease/exonuclease/phosphatase family protein [Bifidobacteriaceae bacterium NR047]
MSFLLAILWVIFAALLCWQLLRWLPAGADKYNPLPYIIALLPLATYVVGALFFVSLGASLWNYFYAHKLAQSYNFAQSYAYLCIAYAVLFLISLKSYAPYWFGRLRRLRKEQLQTPEKIRVMTLNCRYGKASAAQIIETAKKYNVNTLLLQELSESLVKNLKKLGIYEIFPTSCLGAQSAHNNGGFNAIFTKYSAISTCNNSVKIEAASVPSITTRLDFDAPANVFVKFASAHPKSPMRGCKAWSEGIRALANLIDSAETYEAHETYESAENTKSSNLATLTILTGDLNSAIDHPSFRTLIKAGFADSAISLGQRLRTWPTWLKWPNLTLDHVLFCAKNLRAKAVWQQNVEIDGTDHLAYIAEIALYPMHSPMHSMD